MDMLIAPIENKVFGAIVKDVELRSISGSDFFNINAALLDYGFLVFPSQFLTKNENVALGERFGELEFAATPFANAERGNEGNYNKIIDLQSQRMRVNLGNEVWHTDSTYKPVSSKCALLSAVKVPEEGGETELADARAGYAALSQAMRDYINTLSAYHSTQFSQANDLGDFPILNQETNFHGEAYLRPLVKTHPETGIRSLFVARHAFGIPGLSRAESRRLLKKLIEVVVSDASRVYRHRWQVGDTILWDNRCLLHRAMPYDYNKTRVLLGTRIAGNPESELAYYPSDPEAEAGRQALAFELEFLREEVRNLRYGSTTANS